MPGHQVGVQTIASAQLFPHSYECGHSHGKSLIPPWVIRTAIHGEALPFPILGWSRNQPP